jgi:hypothetical protein
VLLQSLCSISKFRVISIQKIESVGWGGEVINMAFFSVGQLYRLRIHRRRERRLNNAKSTASLTPI